MSGRSVQQFVDQNVDQDRFLDCSRPGLGEILDARALGKVGDEPTATPEPGPLSAGVHIEQLLDVPGGFGWPNSAPTAQSAPSARQELASCSVSTAQAMTLIPSMRSIGTMARSVRRMSSPRTMPRRPARCPVFH